MTTLESLNMKFVGINEAGNEEITGGAILECSRSWTKEQLGEWLPKYDIDMIDAVLDWLQDDAQIAEGCYLRVWVD